MLRYQGTAVLVSLYLPPNYGIRINYQVEQDHIMCDILPYIVYYRKSIIKNVDF